MNDNEVKESLPFSESKQRAVLGHLLLDLNFFIKAHNLIKPEWFLDTYNHKILKAKIEFYKKYNRQPSLEELKDSRTFLEEDLQVRSRMIIRVQEALNETVNFQLDVIHSELTDWLHSRIFKESFMKSRDLYNAKKDKEAYAIIKKASRDIEDIKFSQDLEAKFDDFKLSLQNQELELENAISFGISSVDKLLLPNSKSGSLLKGDTTLILAPTNVGKTSTLITILAFNVLKGKDVLWISHEDTVRNLQNKLWCNILDKNYSQLLDMYKDVEGIKKFENMLITLDKHLTFVPYNKVGVTVEEITDYIKIKQQEHIAKYGKGYDLIVDDYPSKLRLSYAKEVKMEFRNSLYYIYDAFGRLAEELKVHVLIAAQTNREAAKANNKRGDDNRLLTPEDVGESYGIAQLATNVISVNRDHKAQTNNRITYYICKSRSSMVGWAIVCRSNFANCRTHVETGPTCWYKGTKAMSDKVDQFLIDYNNQEIPIFLVEE